MTKSCYYCIFIEDGKPTRNLKEIPFDHKLDFVSVLFERMK